MLHVAIENKEVVYVAIRECFIQYVTHPLKSCHLAMNRKVLFALFCVFNLLQLAHGQSSGGGGGSSGGGRIGGGGTTGRRSSSGGGSTSCDRQCGIIVGSIFGGIAGLVLLCCGVYCCTRPRPPRWTRHNPSYSQHKPISKYDELVGIPPQKWVAWYDEGGWVKWNPNFIIHQDGTIHGQGHDRGDFNLQPFTISGQLSIITENTHFTFTKQYYKNDAKTIAAHAIHYHGVILKYNQYWLWKGKWTYKYNSGQFVSYTECKPNSSNMVELDLEMN